jgi:hypothetical protein
MSHCCFFLRAVEKTALLQILVVRWLVRFANVLFCALAVFIFFFLQQNYRCVVFFSACVISNFEPTEISNIKSTVLG